ncbi:MAG: 16S rRNA (uracil(1498)-N(3))-methyltransferase [Verrucomicrobiota bacterium]|nr:16S rRNA (uracil(1498)-N(3))-methyltransferase [Verrucomicrobiota bacterium]
MHRFYVPPPAWNPDALRLSGSEAHHARNVLRLQPGEKAVLFNGRGHQITGEITDLTSREIALRKLHENCTPPLRCRITLGQAIPKGRKMDLIVQKAVEIGAAEIAPIISDRTIVRLGEEEAAQKQAKWQTIAIEAAKQCGQNWLPDVQTPQTMAQFFAGHGHFDLQLIGSLQSDALHLKQILVDYEAAHSDRPASVLMLIGPEGDFTPAELNHARSHGCQPITLGPIVLRVETAAIYCLSVLSYELLG